jgi:restriction system protein
LVAKERKIDMPDDKQFARSQVFDGKLLRAALSILRDNGKEMPMRDLVPKVEEIVKPEDWALKRYPSGAVRWKITLSFVSAYCVKAGWLIKKKGVWYLTPEGEEALKLGPDELLRSFYAAGDKWHAEHPVAREEAVEAEAPAEVASYDEVEQTAMEGLQNCINSKNPYEFQDLVAALLRGMGYYTPFVAPKGKDGGVDIVAYRDPLGTESPRIKVQVKHRDSPATAQEVRQLMGLLKKEGEVGIFVSTGGFTPDGRNEARSSQVHVELIDLNRFISLWQDFYDKLKEEDKSLLPLRPIYFLAQTE